MYISSTSSIQCQVVTNMVYGCAQLMLSYTQLFLIGIAPSSPNNLYMYKVTFSNTLVDWANSLACSSGTWSASNSESLLSVSGTNIYSFITYGISASRYLYFLTQSVSDGSVTATKYKSTVCVNSVFGSALNEDYVIRPKYVRIKNQINQINLI